MRVLLSWNQLILISWLSVDVGLRYDLGRKHALHFVILLPLRKRTQSTRGDGRRLLATFDIHLLSFRLLSSSSSSSCVLRQIFNFCFLWAIFTLLGAIHFLAYVTLAWLCFSLLLSLLNFRSSLHQFKNWANRLISVLGRCSILTRKWPNFNFFNSISLLHEWFCPFSFFSNSLLTILAKRGGLQASRCLLDFWKLWTFLFHYFFLSFASTIWILELIGTTYHESLKLIWRCCKNSIIFYGFFRHFFLLIFKQMTWQWTYSWYFGLLALIIHIIHRTIGRQQIAIRYLGWWLSTMEIAHYICWRFLVFHVLFNSSLSSFFRTDWWAFAFSSLTGFGTSVIWRSICR